MKFAYKDEVEVIGGFYKGFKGQIRDAHKTFFSYQYEIDLVTSYDDKIWKSLRVKILEKHLQKKTCTHNGCC
jgi:hypothetical protein